MSVDSTLLLYSLTPLTRSPTDGLEYGFPSNSVFTWRVASCLFILHRFRVASPRFNDFTILILYTIILILFIKVIQCIINKHELQL